jgi:hypothetical protein
VSEHAEGRQPKPTECKGEISFRGSFILVRSRTVLNGIFITFHRQQNNLDGRAPTKKVLSIMRLLDKANEVRSSQQRKSTHNRTTVNVRRDPTLWLKCEGRSFLLFSVDHTGKEVSSFNSGKKGNHQMGHTAYLDAWSVAHAW